MIKYILLLLLSFLLSCSTKSPKPREPPPDTKQNLSNVKPIITCINVAEDMRAKVEEGVYAWDYSIGKAWRPFRLGEDDCNLRIFEVDPWDDFGNHPCKDPNAFGCVDKLGGLGDDDYIARIYLISGSYEQCAKNVVMHEVGHTLGLSHMPGTLMQGTWPISLQIAMIQCPDRMTIDSVSMLHDIKGARSCPWTTAFSGFVVE